MNPITPAAARKHVIQDHVSLNGPIIDIVDSLYDFIFDARPLWDEDARCDWATKMSLKIAQ